MSLFPSVASLEEYEVLRHDDGLFRPGASAIAAALGLSMLPLGRFPDGSLPVYAVGDALVLKLYPPFELEERDREAAALSATEGRLSIPTPRVQGVGELERWGYLLMDRLNGRKLDEAWAEIEPSDRLALAAQLGEGLAELHAIRGAGLDPLGVDWLGFLAEQRRTAVERQRSRGLDEEWCGLIEEYLEGTFSGAILGEGRADSLLHTEIMREHLLVDRRSNGWRISGLFDFEPSMVGAVEYEFVSVGIFVSSGSPAILRQLLSAYGYPESKLDESFARRMMAWCLLHRYCHLPWYMRHLPPAEETRSLQALAEAWWGTSG